MLCLVAVCVLRAIGADGHTAEIAITSTTPWLLVPSLPLSVLAAWRRRWRLSALAVGTLVMGVVWEAPVMWPFPVAAAASSTGHIRVYDANIAQDNFRPAEVAREIQRDRPDVVAIEELTPAASHFLRHSGTMARFRWGVVEARWGAGGLGLWSSIPLTSPRVWSDGMGQEELDAWLHPSGAQPVQLNVMHVYAPVGYDEPQEWIAQLNGLRAHLLSDLRRGPVVAVGDFNATADDRPFQEILAVGLKDAAVLAGKGWTMSWPRNVAFWFPFVRIDHVLVSRSLTVTGYGMGVGSGSDHHPLIVDVAPRATSVVGQR